jgi:hypothetical protein
VVAPDVPPYKVSPNVVRVLTVGVLVAVVAVVAAGTVPVTWLPGSDRELRVVRVLLEVAVMLAAVPDVLAALLGISPEESVVPAVTSPFAL